MSSAGRQYITLKSTLLINKAAAKPSREESRRLKDLDAARKAGTVPAEVDEDGKEINPHIPEFMSKAPWYVATGKPSLKHQKNAGASIFDTSDINNWYARGQKAGPAATKYRKGACENCGAMSHKTKDCMERPRKTGAKYNPKDIIADEVVQTFNDSGWDTKRDRWNGYDPAEHQRVVEEYERIEEARRKLKEQELDKKDATDAAADEDEEKYADEADMVGQKLNTKTRVTVRNLRIREDTAKYLINLDPDSAHYDPKTRSMRDNPNATKDPNDYAFAGDNFTRMSGDATEMNKAQLFAWQAEARGTNVHLQANPTMGEMLHKQYRDKKEKLSETTKSSILEKYGGEEYLKAPPKELLFAQTENYVEYSRSGQVIKGRERAIPKSKYEEDVYINNHASVFGSYWSEGQWGYTCCHQFIRNSYCTGEVGLESSKGALKMLEVAKEEAGKSAEGQSSEDDEPTRRRQRSEDSEPRRKRDRTPNDTDERKRKYNSFDAKDVTEEELEAYRRKRTHFEDPMANFKDAV